MHPPLSTPLIGLCISLSCLWNYFIAEAPSNPLLNRPKIKFLFSGANRFMVGHNGLYIIGLNRGGGGRMHPPLSTPLFGLLVELFYC